MPACEGFIRETLLLAEHGSVRLVLIGERGKDDRRDISTGNAFRGIHFRLVADPNEDLIAALERINGGAPAEHQPGSNNCNKATDIFAHACPPTPLALADRWRARMLQPAAFALR